MNSKKIKPKSPTPPSLQFPSAWLWMVDEAIPDWVKKTYSPRESWKSKPFSKEDARFFFKGIEDLSELFTQERLKNIPPYFQHPKYRSSYLLYFLPLQAAKFLTLFNLHPRAIEAALAHAKKQGVLRVADLGAGPGTASLSLLLYLLDKARNEGFELPPIEFEWFDLQKGIMEDGKALAETLSTHFPKLRGKVQVNIHTLPWWKAPSQLRNELSLVFVGHLLNESSTVPGGTDAVWANLLHQAEGGGVLIVEPAARRPSQTLSGLRDRIFDLELIERTPTRIWGPCLHAEACPLAGGRDWCHFSVPTHIPGDWFKDFSKALSSERQWVKYSYLWLASSSYPSPKPDPQLRRVVSDPLNQGHNATVLICEPERPGRWTASAKKGIYRGDLIKISQGETSPKH